jgi:hypothetical protein
MRHTHDTTFSEKILDFYKNFSQISIFFKNKMKNHSLSSKIFVKIKNFFRKSCVMCVPHQNFTFASKIFNFNKKNEKKDRCLLKTFSHVTDCWRTWPRSVFSKVGQVRQTPITHLLPFDWLWYKTFRISSDLPITNTAWVRALLCKLQKRCTRLAAASDKV